MEVKAAVLKETGQPVTVETILLNDKLDSGQVLIKINYAGVCHSQLMEQAGARGEDKYLPHLFGHEASATVISIADDVNKVKPNDKVIVSWIKGHGKDALGAISTSKDGQKINSGPCTVFSEYSIVAENRLTILPDNIPLDIAALFGCAMLTGMGMIFNGLKPIKATSIAIWGVGGIGMSALLSLLSYSCKQIIVIDPNENKLMLAKKIGATHAINPTKESALEKIMQLTESIGVDYAIEAAGNVKTIEQAFLSVKNFGGLCVFASHPKYGEKLVIDPFEFIKGKKLQGAWGGYSQPDRDIIKIAQLYQKHSSKFHEVFANVGYYRLEEINQAMSDLKNGIVVRPLIKM